MLQSVEGVFRKGRVELLETPPNIQETRVIVTFLTETVPPAGESPFTAEEIADLRGKLSAWEDDWNAPGMEAYDDYEARRSSVGSLPTE
jgi:hypothetical protein